MNGGSAIAFLCLVGAALRLWMIRRPSLWFDEAKTLIILRVPAHDALGLIRNLEGIPPLYFLTTHVWTRPFTDPLLGLRLLSVVFGVTTLWLFALLSRRCLGAQGRWAAALACASPFWIHLSQDGRAYALYLLEVVALALAWNDLDREWTNRGCLAYGAAALAGLYTHTCFGFAMLAPFVLGIYSPEIRRRLRGWGVLHAAIGLAFLPWLPDLRAQMAVPHTALLSQPLTLKNLGLLFAAQASDLPFLDLALAQPLAVFGWSLAGTVLLAAAWMSRRESPEARRPLIFAMLHIAIPLCAVRLVEILSGRSLAQPRYLLFISPYVYLAAGWVLGRIPTPWIRRAWIGAMTLSACGYFACREFIDPRLRELSTDVRRFSPREEPLVHLDPYNYLALRYYYLPEKRHLLLCADPKILPWQALPGYPAAAKASGLERLETVAVFDPRRALFPAPLSRSTGRQLAEYRCR